MDPIPSGFTPEIGMRHMANGVEIADLFGITCTLPYVKTTIVDQTWIQLAIVV